MTISTQFNRLCLGITALVLLCTFFSLGVLAEDSSPVFRFYSQTYKSHFYTASPREKDFLISSDENWCYEGVGYYLDSVNDGQAPLYRFYSPIFKSHFYTISTSERNRLMQYDNDWTYEGTAFNVDVRSSVDNTPLYRFYSPIFKSHFYTLSETEKDRLIKSDSNWRYEGIAYYTQSGPALAPDNPCDREPPIGELGIDMSVGLDEYERDDIREHGISVTATNASFYLLDRDREVIASLEKDASVEIRYDSDGYLLALWDDKSARLDKEVFLEGQDDRQDLVFSVTRKEEIDESYSLFRGSVSVRYSKSVRRIWLINTLPLEQYVWGIGEITATGPVEYNRLMTTAFRTYGYWKIRYSTRYIAQGFVVLATPANQIYRGYSWEKEYPRIKEAAIATRGQVATFEEDVILLPFSSWTDGETRHYSDGHWSSQCNSSPQEEVSDIFPYLLSVDDSLGKHPSLSTCELASLGNHMVGISANGALNLAKEKGWDSEKIYKHYISGGVLTQQY